MLQHDCAVGSERFLLDRGEVGQSLLVPTAVHAMVRLLLLDHLRLEIAQHVHTARLLLQICLAGGVSAGDVWV